MPVLKEVVGGVIPSRSVSASETFTQDLKICKALLRYLEVCSEHVKPADKNKWPNKVQTLSSRVHNWTLFILTF